jgi:hypothetical protein
MNFIDWLPVLREMVLIIRRSVSEGQPPYAIAQPHCHQSPVARAKAILVSPFHLDLGWEIN